MILVLNVYNFRTNITLGSKLFSKGPNKMSSYSSSTQKKYWTFKDAEELLKYRRNANYKYIHSNENSFKVGFHDTNLCSFAIRA